MSSRRPIFCARGAEGSLKTLETYHAALQALRRDEIFAAGQRSSSSWQAAIQLFGVAKAQLQGPNGPNGSQLGEHEMWKLWKTYGEPENVEQMVGFLYQA